MNFRSAAAAILGFLLGAGLAVGVLMEWQRTRIAPVATDVTYHFYSYLFSGDVFPAGDLENGRMIRRCLLPVKITLRFYDAQYHEVTRAERPGRYGAVVQVDSDATRSYRYITLYRLPEKVHWDVDPLRVSAQLPAGTGLDPAVVSRQQEQIGEAIRNSVIDDDGHTAASLAVLFAGLSETPADAPPAVARTGVIARDADWWFGLRQRLGLEEKYPYVTDLPAAYAADPGKRWPLILYLHNADERGHDLEVVRHSGLAGRITAGGQVPAIVIAPQLPADQAWDPRVLTRLLDEVGAKYRVDPDRVYLTGISAGGDATWDLALLHPERFAAAVPICGDNDPADAARVARLPIWAFHGAKDPVVPVQASEAMIAAIRAAGGHPHLTIVPDAGHDAWDAAYATPALYTWLFAQKRGQAEVVTPGVPEAK